MVGNAVRNEANVDCDDGGIERNRVRSFEVIGINSPCADPFAPTMGNGAAPNSGSPKDKQKRCLSIRSVPKADAAEISVPSSSSVMIACFCSGAESEAKWLKSQLFGVIGGSSNLYSSKTDHTRRFPLPISQVGWPGTDDDRRWLPAVEYSKLGHLLLFR